MNGLEIAVIGMTCRFPGAENLDVFWRNLRDGVESIAHFSKDELSTAGIAPAHINNSAYVNARGILPDIEYFDASFFGYSPKESEMMDPQQRIFLEEAWKTLEHAGYNPEIYAGAIGVYAGLGMNTYLLNNLAPNVGLLDSATAYQMMIGNNRDFLTTRVSYKLNLRGPGVTVQTACSTSLVAIHLACQSLLTQECDLALAGGITIVVPQHSGYLYQEGMILSPDGHCRAFDAGAKGTVGGSGVGIVALKRLVDAFEDGDTIHAVIKGSAINNDGASKIGYTAPGVEGQASVIEAAQAMADVEPDTISYLETHGTGTRLGDPIEIRALTQTFRRKTHKTGFCAIGSVKTNIGHTDTAAGVAGFIKTVLMLTHRQIPPSLHVQRPNPELQLEQSPFYVNARLAEWTSDGVPLRSGVSSFGIGGTNAHVVLEEFETPHTPHPTPNANNWQLVVLSAKTEIALTTAAANLSAYFRQHPYLNLADAAYTLQVGRKHFKHRRIVFCRFLAEAIDGLESPELSSQPPSEKSLSEGETQFIKAGQIWLEGGEVNWTDLYIGERRQRVPLPTYPFERQRYWIEPPQHISEPHANSEASRRWQSVVEACNTQARLEMTDMNMSLYQQKKPVLDRLCLAYMQQALFDLGAFHDPQQSYTIADIMQRCRILSKYRQLVSQWLAFLVEHERVQQQEESFMNLLPIAPQSIETLTTEIEEGWEEGRLLERIRLGGEHHVPLLRGEQHPQQVLLWETPFESGVPQSERKSPLIRFYNMIIRAALQHIINDLSPQTALSILEIGAGTGMTTAWLLPILPPQQVRYVFSDVGLLFLNQAKQQFCNYPYVEYKQLDIEHPPEEQGYKKYRFDVVLAANVLHVTQDIHQTLQHVRSLLAPGGLLLLWEITQPQLFFAVTDAFLMNPIEDQKRNQGAPFLAQHQWAEALQRHGFTKLSAFPETEVFGMHIIVAQASSSPEKGTPQAFTTLLQQDARVRKKEEAVSAHQSSQKIADRYVAPRNKLEHTIADLWSEALGIESVGIHDNFFELGGDSLLTVQFISRLQTASQVNLTQSHIIEAPTVALLASVIENMRMVARQTVSLLVNIRPHGSRLPLFCIHPAGGTIFPYVNLARYLNAEQPVYGIQSPAFGGEKEYSNLADRAARYIETIKGVQPEGPYLLAGMSYGGNMAVEMGAQLKNQGDEVALTALFDSYPQRSYQHQVEDPASFLTAFLLVTEVTFESHNLRKLSHDPHFRQQSEDEQWNEILKHIDTLRLDRMYQKIPNIFSIWKKHHSEIKDHILQHYPGRITFFQAYEKIPHHLDTLLKMDVNDKLVIEEWNRIASEPIERIVIPGNHLTILDEPHVQILAELLSAIIKKAQAEYAE